MRPRNQNTTFNVPPENRKRIARLLAEDPITNRGQNIAILDQPVKSDCAGSCAFSTVADYLRFGPALLNGGIIDGKRALSPKTVRATTSDHSGGNIKNNVAQLDWHRDGYGFGVRLVVCMQDSVAARPSTAGDDTWHGADGTAFWVDAKQRLVVVYGTVAPGEIRKYYREPVGALVGGGDV